MAQWHRDPHDGLSYQKVPCRETNHVRPWQLVFLGKAMLCLICHYLQLGESYFHQPFLFTLSYKWNSLSGYCSHSGQMTINSKFTLNSVKRIPYLTRTLQESASGAGDSKVFIWYMLPPWGPRGRAPKGQNFANFKLLLQIQPAQCTLHG